MELLSPAGDWDALRAAVQNGADAVYLGGSMGNARAGAVNFDTDNLCRALDYCHERGVKLYLTANTLLFDEEFRSLREMIEPAVRFGLDAAIVQDLGVAAFLRDHYPDLKLHASTQMCISNLQGAWFAKELGFSRVVPARECSLAELEKMVHEGIEVECFGHGALCVSFSGQCYLSSFIGARSGNRGKCAQPCRMQYVLNGENGYFLSTSDLCVIDRLPELVKSGITSLKLEGRLKRGEYVAAVTAAYRKALDAAQAGLPWDVRKEIEKLAVVFSRGFTHGYLFGKNDADLMHTEAPNHSGLELGTIPSVRGGYAFVPVKHKPGIGDTLLWRKGERSGTVQAEAEVRNGILKVKLPSEAQGGTLSLVRSEEAEKNAKESFQQERRRRPVELDIKLRIGEYPELTVKDGIYRECVRGDDPVQAARNQATDRETIQRQIQRLGNVPLRAENIQIEMDEGIFMPVSVLNELRRRGVEKYLANFHIRRGIPDYPMEEKSDQAMEKRTEAPLLILQNGDLRELAKAEDICDLLYYAPADIRTEILRDALRNVPVQKPVYVVLPPLLTSEETDDILCVLHDNNRIAGIVANNLGQIQEWKGMDSRPVVADTGINCLNSRAAEVLRTCKVDRITVSMESTLANASRLASAYDCEMICHGKLGLMTLRHCPLRTRKGLGEGHASCMLCGKKGYSLTDRKGVVFPMIPYVAESGCYVRLYNAHTLDALNCWEKVSGVPVRALRVLGSAQEAEAYRKQISGEHVSLTVDHPTNGLWFRQI